MVVACVHFVLRQGEPLLMLLLLLLLFLPQMAARGACACASAAGWTAWQPSMERHSGSAQGVQCLSLPLLCSRCRGRCAAATGAAAVCHCWVTPRACPSLLQRGGVPGPAGPHAAGAHSGAAGLTGSSCSSGCSAVLCWRLCGVHVHR